MVSKFLVQDQPITTIICENKGLTNTDALRLMAAINNNPAVVRTLTHLSFANSNNVFNNDANQISCMLDLTKLKIVERIKYAKANLKGLKELLINTNASRLTEELSIGLLNSGLDTIYFSVDGATAETYNKIRVNLDYN